MIVNKLSDPKSKLGIFQWLSAVFWLCHGFDERVLETPEEVEEQEKEKETRKKEVMKLLPGLRPFPKNEGGNREPSLLAIPCPIQYGSRLSLL